VALDIEVATGDRGVRCEKLRAPTPPGSHVPRLGLVQRLLDSDAEVITVSAPAGAGKTTLLASWAAAPEVAGHAAWLSLDHHDTTAVRMWEVLLAALRGLPSLPEDHPVRGFGVPVGEVDERFAERVMASIASLDGPVWLVLDDVHRVRAPAALAVLADLMARRPGHLRLVMASRTDPPPLRRRAGSAQTLLELGASDLAFTAAEVAELLSLHGLDLDQQARTLLLARTEGWAAGLRLAVAGLMSTDDHRGFLARFDGDLRSVADYLASELLRQLPGPLLDLLLKTSVCADLEEPLAVELSGRSDAGSVLEALVRDNALVVREAGSAPHYRYHQLLRTFLEAELRRRDLRLWQHLHGVAARWYLDVGRPERALGHAVTCEDRELVESLLGRQGLAALLDGEPDRLAEVLHRLPSRWREDALPQALRAALALEENDALTAGLRLTRARAAADAREPWLATFLEVLELRHARLADEEGRLIAAVDALAEGGAGEHGDPELELYVLEHRGLARLALGRLDDGLADLRRARELAHRAGRPAAVVVVSARLAAVTSALGSWQEAIDHASLAVEWARPRGWDGTLMVAPANLVLARQAYLEVDHARLQRYVTALGSAATRAPTAAVRLAARLTRAFAALEDGAPVRPALQEVSQLWEAAEPGQLSTMLLLATWGPVEVHRALRSGERDRAEVAAQRVRRWLPDTAEAALVAAALAGADRRAEAARAELLPVLTGQRQALQATSGVTARVVAAELALAVGDRTRAAGLLEEALALAAPPRWWRPFTEVSEATRCLVGELVEAHLGELPALAGLRAALRRTQPVRAVLTPLTPAERDLLQELPSLRTVPEIAGARHVSVNTVKSQLSSVYRKLDVHGRRAAVEVARAHGLL